MRTFARPEKLECAPPAAQFRVARYGKGTAVPRASGPHVLTDCGDDLALTEATVDDATMAIELIKAVDGRVASITGTPPTTRSPSTTPRARRDRRGATGQDGKGISTDAAVQRSAIARFGRCRRSDDDSGKRRLATIARPVWRTPSSDTSRSSGTVFTRAVRRDRGLRPPSHATSSIR